MSRKHPDFNGETRKRAQRNLKQEKVLAGDSNRVVLKK